MQLISNDLLTVGLSQEGYSAVTRVFNRPEFSGRHDFQAKKFGRQCTKSGSHAVGLQEKSSKKNNTMENNIYSLHTINVVLGFESKQHLILA